MNSFLGGRTLHLMIPSLSIVRGTVSTHLHFRVTQWKLAIFTNVGVQTYNVHILNLLPFLDYVIYFASFGSTP